jgi:hypothetical protein
LEEQLLETRTRCEKKKKKTFEKLPCLYHRGPLCFVFVFFSLSFTLPFSYFSIAIIIDNNNNELPPPPTTFGVPSSQLPILHY